MKAIYLLMGIYILMVVYQGNEKELFSLLASESGYVVWIVAIALYWLIWNAAENTEKELVDAFGGLVLVALAMKAVNMPNFMAQFSQMKNALQSFSTSSTSTSGG